MITPRQALSSQSGVSRLANPVALPRARDSTSLLRIIALAATGLVIFLVLLVLPVVESDPAALTSDQSLYLSEAYNIATGKGPTYPSGEVVQHRAPLFPSLLAAPIRLAGGDFDAAYIVPKVVMLLLIGATFLVAWQAFDWIAGGAAALLVASSAFLRWLGTTLFLDGTETLFMLLSIAALLRAFRTDSAFWFGSAGLLIGAAFWTKEAALLLLPLPVIFVLLTPNLHTPLPVRGIAAYLAASGSVTGAWWIWVLAVTGRFYIWGEPDFSLVTLGLSVVGVCVAAWAAANIVQRRSAASGIALLRWYGLALAGVWCGAMLFGLEIAASWPYPWDYLTNVPRYLAQIAAPNTQPWPLVAAGVVWLAWRSFTDDRARIPGLAFLLFLPFALHTANRSLSYRDSLPLVYLGYIAAGGLSVWLIRQAPVQTRTMAIAGAVVGITLLGWYQTQDLRNDWLPYDAQAVDDRNWDNPLVADTAAWINANVPDGAIIMSSRLYFSHIYVLDQAKHPIYQLPTVRVEPSAGQKPFLEPASMLFRWEEYEIEPLTSDDWLHIQRYPGKNYYVALSQAHLLNEIERRQADYIVIAGTDVAFSSLSYVDYFRAHPGFVLLHADRRNGGNATYVFKTKDGPLALQQYHAAIDEKTLQAISEDTGLSLEDAARAIDADGVKIE